MATKSTQKHNETRERCCRRCKHGQEWG